MSILPLGPALSHTRKVGFLASRFFITLVVIAAMVVGLLPPITVHADGETISGGSDTTGNTDAYIPITGITVTGDPEAVVPVNVSVDRGQLSMTTTTGLTFTGSPTGSTLNFEGTVSDVNAALATLRYRTTYAETVTLAAQLTSPGEVYFPDNGHIYEVVAAPGNITADDALTAAAARTKYGAQGYLATITTQAENDYVGPRLNGDGWFGARDSDVEGDWEWVTGPEAGTLFWQGIGGDGGAPVSDRYSNWASGEPNDYGGGEDCAQFYSDGSGWNDLPCSDSTLGYYIVEYGTGGEDMPYVASISHTITTTFPAPNDVPIGDCLDLIDVYSDQNDHRYDHLQLTSDIDCTGHNLAPMFSDDDPDFGALSFRGTFDGQGHTISNLTVDQASNNDVALIENANGATITNLHLANGSVIGVNCTGALVGRAYDTTITNVTSGVSVDGSDSTGGLVGCYYAQDDDTSMTGNSVSAAVSGNQYVGGLVGYSEVNNGHTLTFENNTWSGTLADDDNWAYGGLLGELDLYNASHLSLKNNTSSGVSLVSGYSVGGLVGYMDLEGQSTATIEANTITGDTLGYSYVGALVGELDLYQSRTTITNSTVTHDVTGESGDVGGLIGELYMEGSEASNTKLTITNTSVGGDVTGDYSVGGLVGEGYGDYGEEQIVITNVHTTGDVTGPNGSVGGLLGAAALANIEDAYATGTITGNTDVGGLVGDLEDATITNSYATGDIVNGGDSGGGLVGETYNVNILRSFATGAVTGYGAVGGLVGYFNSSNIYNSYARGSADGSNAVGGLVGSCYGSVANSYATGFITVDGGDAGGLIGYDADCSVGSSFWDVETSGQDDSTFGTGKTTAEMKDTATFTDTENSDGLDEAWDFESIWTIDAVGNNGYPCLTWYSQCADDDADGASSSTEDAAPNSGDANNDGTTDSTQSNVASFVNAVTGHYTSVALPVACSLSSTSAQTEASQAAQDSGYQYQSGLVHFSADCGTPGYTATVKVYMYGVASSDLVLRKYNPTTHAYFTVSSAVITQETIGGQLVAVATYSITDGGDLDTDGTVNGVIVDPVGLATSAIGAPNTGLGGRR